MQEGLIWQAIAMQSIVEHIAFLFCDQHRTITPNQDLMVALCKITVQADALPWVGHHPRERLCCVRTRRRERQTGGFRRWCLGRLAKLSRGRCHELWIVRHAAVSS